MKIIYGVAVPVSIPVGEIVAVALGSIVPLTPTVEVITVRRLLRQGRYVLRANRKRLNKKHDPDRDRLYDVPRNKGFVVVGTTHQTPQFAVAEIRRWWLKVGQAVYRRKKHLLIEADCGGANVTKHYFWT